MSYTVVHQAILDRRSLTARYDGAVLHFSPHALGRHKDKSLRVVAFQYAGRGPASPAPGEVDLGRWRCLSLARLKRVAPNLDGWHSGHDRRQPLHCVVQVVVASW
jgi:hypothetical protein